MVACLLLMQGCRSQASLGDDAGSNQNHNQNSNQGADAALPDAVSPDALVLAEDPHLLPDLAVTGVELYQAVQIPLYEDGAAIGQAARNAPVVAGREAVFRVYAVPADPGSWTSRQVRAELFLGPVGVRPFDPQDPGAAQSIVVTEARLVSGPSLEADLESTFVLRVPATHVSAMPAMAWAVRLVDPTETSPAVQAGTANEARVPADGLTAHPLQAEEDGGGIELVLVPLRYDRDGSGRLPDTSPAQLGLIDAMLTNLYPASVTSITVHEPIPWNNSLTWTGNFDFGDLNEYLVDLRVEENAPARAHYYGLVCPADTFGAYCGSSCVTGQSYLVSSPEDGDYRVGGGMGYSGEDSVWTLAHELGHQFGRSHAPCGVSSYDSSYPYSGGSIGVFGMDLRQSLAPLLSPEVYTDLMGYCDDTWVSDYTYKAFFLRLIAVNALPPPPLPAPLLPGPWLQPGALLQPEPGGAATAPIVRYRALRLSPGERPTWGRSLRSRTARHSGEAHAVIIRDARGRELLRPEAPMIRHGHGGGARLLVPEPFPPGAATLELPRSIATGFGIPHGASRLALPAEAARPAPR
jgi:hypothetical protein